MQRENDRSRYSSIKGQRPTDEHPSSKGGIQMENQYKQITTQTMQNIKEYLKMCADLSSSYDIFNKKMVEDIEDMEKAIRSAPAQFAEDPLKISNLLERVMASLNAPSARLMNLVVESKRRQLIEAYKVYTIT